MNAVNQKFQGFKPKESADKVPAKKLDDYGDDPKNYLEWKPKFESYSWFYKIPRMYLGDVGPYVSMEVNYTNPWKSRCELSVRKVSRHITP